MDDRCKTKYPIILIEGMGFPDHRFINYWGRIPDALRSKGTQIFILNQDTWGTIEEEAEKDSKRILEILKDTNAEKVNIIAHSMGGLESRYLISTLNMGNKIASLTTIATPHHGSKTIDFFMGHPIMMRCICLFINLCGSVLGVKNPNFYRVSKQLTTNSCNQFNNQNADSNHVYYQSYASLMKNPFSDLMFALPNFIINKIEGKNDGLVTTVSAEWTNFKGILSSPTNRGISHGDSVDIRRNKFSKKIKANTTSDICKFYLGICIDLKKLNF